MGLYIAWKPLAADDIALGRHPSRKNRRNRRAETQALFNNRVEKRKLRHSIHRDFLIVRKSPADFAHQFPKALGIFQQVAHDAREHGSGRLAARNHQDGEGRFDFRDRHPLLIIVPADIRHEIWALGIVALFEAFVDARFRELEMVEASLHNRSRQHPAEEGLAAGDEPAACKEGDGLEGLEEERDPRVVFARFEAAEGFAEGEVARDVEEGEIEPSGDVHNRRLLRRGACLFPKLFD